MTSTAASSHALGAPRVSFVMSVYNDASHVEAAVASVLEQSFESFELVVVDDGSTDGGGSILDRLAASDIRVRVVHQANSGLTEALIRGCREARGEYIARQDSDDRSHPQRIAEQVALLERDPGVGFVSCATEYVGPRGEPLMVISRNADSQLATKGLLQEKLGPPAHGSVMFRRSLYESVGGYRAQFHFAQDADLWLRMAEVARVAYLPEVRYVALRETDSTSGVRRPLQRQFGELAMLCRQARASGGDEGKFLAKAGEMAEAIRAGSSGARPDKKALSDAAYFIGAQLAQNRDPRARPYLLQAIGLRLWHWKAWVRLMQTLHMKPALESRNDR